MREYYGELSNCSEYVEDKNHKAVPWKDYAFSFEFCNGPEHVLELRRKGRLMSVEPGKKVEVRVKDWDDGEIFVCAKDNSELNCSFCVERGCMVKRNLVKHEMDRVYIAPIFKDGIVTVVTCDDCGPNFSTSCEYEIKPLDGPVRMVSVYNFAHYDVILSVEGRVIQRINSNEKKLVGIPLSGVLYVDTVLEEVAWKDRYNVYEEAILRVNGCCIKIGDDGKMECVSVMGPALAEPYIRHLYANFEKVLEDEGDINIWCNTIDFRLD